MTQRQRQLVIAAVLLFVTFLVHARAIGYGFCVYDDKLQIVTNPTLNWASVPSYFVSDVWRSPLPQFRSYYRPLFLLWLLINFKLFGLHPAAWHLASLTLHGIVVLLVYRLGLRLMGDEAVAVAAALLFAVHPAHVESVVWLSGVTEPLSAVFFVGALLAYLRWRERQTPGPMALYALLTMLALLAKETGAAIPVLIALYEWLYPSGAVNGARERVLGAARAVLPAVGVTAVYAAMRFHAAQNIVAVNNSPAQVLMTWPLLLWKYLGMMVWPSGLAILYDTRILAQPSWESFGLPMLFVAACGALLVWAFARNRLAAFLGCWWLLPIIPALVGLFCFSAADIVHDRYTYLSSIAFMLLLAWGLMRLPSGGVKAFGLPAGSVVVLLAVSSAWAMLSARQTQVWRSGFTLFSHTVLISPHNLRARNLLANQLVETGHLPEALGLYAATLQEAPDAWETNFAYGVILASDGRVAEGEKLLRHACAVNPRNPETYLALAELLRAENRREDARGLLRDGISKVYSRRDELQKKLTTLE